MICAPLLAASRTSSLTRATFVATSSVSAVWSAATVTFVMAGDPDPGTGQRILEALPGAGADVIELGMAFSDPMADGPGIQLAGRRALDAGQTLRRTLDMVEQFRRGVQRFRILQLRQTEAELRQLVGRG